MIRCCYGEKGSQGHKKVTKVRFRRWEIPKSFFFRATLPWSELVANILQLEKYH
jgi:hypothetical protein